MESVMNGIGKHAVFYRGYQPDDRSLVPLAFVLATGVVFWLFFYLVGAVGPAPSGDRLAVHSAPALSAPAGAATGRTASNGGR
jgi:hypothetical protein